MDRTSPEWQEAYSQGYDDRNLAEVIGDADVNSNPYDTDAEWPLHIAWREGWYNCAQEFNS